MNPSRLALPVLVGAALAGAPALAQDDRTETLQVGSPAPDFELMDAAGASHRLSELVQSGPVVLEFFRSGDW